MWDRQECIFTAEVCSSLSSGGESVSQCHVLPELWVHKFHTTWLLNTNSTVVDFPKNRDLFHCYEKQTNKQTDIKLAKLAKYCNLWKVICDFWEFFCSYPIVTICGKYLNSLSYQMNVIALYMKYNYRGQYLSVLTFLIKKKKKSCSCC